MDAISRRTYGKSVNFNRLGHVRRGGVGSNHLLAQTSIKYK